MDVVLSRRVVEAKNLVERQSAMSFFGLLPWNDVPFTTPAAVVV